jgi:hypothetical protein
VLPDDRTERRDRLLSVFTGGFGRPYDNIVLVGRGPSERAFLQCYFALYVEDGLGVQFERLTDDAPAAREAADIVASCTLQPGEADGQYTVMYGATELATAVMAGMIATALQHAQQAVLAFGLPAAFVTILQTEQGGRRKVVFWYPRGSFMPDKLFETLRALAVTEYGT